MPSSKPFRSNRKPDVETGVALASVSFLVLYVLLMAVLFGFRLVQPAAASTPIPYTIHLTVNR